MEGSVIADRYVVNGVIGSGGMAIVYRGYDRETGEEVAIKVLRSEFMQDDAYVRRFEKESQIAIKYSHKNIVRTIEVGCKEGRHYIVMEYVSGMTLKEYIAKHGRLKPPEVVRIGRQICDALFYAHSHQLIHRDIKPQNILLTSDGIAKVADFGIAKAPETATVTISGSNVLGSVHYISPEQARGGITDEKADIYSIGIVLYEMVTGAVPFTGDTPVAVALKHLQDPPRPPREVVPECPKALELVILKAISKEQACRYDNAREMARDLERSILEPEGSYIKIRTPDETEGTRPMHPIKLEGLQPLTQQTMLHGNTGPRRPLPPRPQQDSQWRNRRRTPVAVSVLLYVLLAAILLAGAYFGFKALVDSAEPQGIKLNDFRGQDVTIAKQQLDTAKIPYKIEEKPSDVDKGLITDQDPGPGEMLEPGATLALTVSSGKQQVPVPDVTNLTDQEAEQKIKDSGLVVGDIRYKTSDQPKDTVVDQKPTANTMLEIGGKVSIWLSQPQDSGLKMPKLFGRTKDEATNLLLGLGVDVNNIKLVSKGSSFVLNTVIGQTPDADTPLDLSAQIQIDVSTGVPPGYSKFFSVSFDVPGDNTNVKIVFVDGDSKTTVFDKPLNTGHYGNGDITIPLDSMTLGDKQLIIYFNDVQQGDPIKVTFTAGDTFTNAG